jgi:hypothetical protein
MTFTFPDPNAANYERWLAVDDWWYELQSTAWSRYSANKAAKQLRRTHTGRGAVAVVKREGQGFGVYLRRRMREDFG